LLVNVHQSRNSADSLLTGLTEENWRKFSFEEVWVEFLGMEYVGRVKEENEKLRNALQVVTILFHVGFSSFIYH